MGGCSIQHTFEHYDWRIGVEDLKREAEEYYGHQEGYSGAINSCCISLHSPKCTLKSIKQAYDYAETRLEFLPNGDGECVRLGLKGYTIIKPVIEPYPRTKNLNFEPENIDRHGKPAVLVSKSGSFVSNGTLSEMKETAKNLLIRGNFKNDYFIVTKSKVFKCTSEKKQVKTTKQQSNTNQVVLPRHTYVVYGWASH